jgi:hypothetical protein
VVMMSVEICDCNVTVLSQNVRYDMIWYYMILYDIIYDMIYDVIYLTEIG